MYVSLMEYHFLFLVHVDNRLYHLLNVFDQGKSWKEKRETNSEEGRRGSTMVEWLRREFIKSDSLKERKLQKECCRISLVIYYGRFVLHHLMQLNLHSNC